MQLKHVFAARVLMQAVNILRDYGLEFSLSLELSQAQMGPVGLCSVHYELGVVESVILSGLRSKNVAESIVSGG